MNDQPKILLIEGDDAESAALQFMSKGCFNLQVEKTPEQAVNRAGFEEFDLVVLDSQVSEATILEPVVQFFRRVHMPVMLFGENIPNTIGYPVLAKVDRSNFVDKICTLLNVANV
jgi:hypothetical protein